MDDATRSLLHLLFDACRRLSIAHVDADAGGDIETTVAINGLTENAAYFDSSVDVHVVRPFDVHINTIDSFHLVDRLTHHQRLQVLHQTDVIAILQRALVGEHERTHGGHPGVGLPSCDLHDQPTLTTTVGLNVRGTHNVHVSRAVGVHEHLRTVEHMRVDKNRVISIWTQLVEEVGHGEADVLVILTANLRDLTVLNRLVLFQTENVHHALSLQVFDTFAKEIVGNFLLLLFGENLPLSVANHSDHKDIATGFFVLAVNRLDG